MGWVCAPHPAHGPGAGVGSVRSPSPAGLNPGRGGGVHTGPVGGVSWSIAISIVPGPQHLIGVAEPLVAVSDFVDHQ